SGDRIDCRLPHFRRKPAARICLVLWTRFALDVFGVGCGRRFRQHAHRVGVYLQISARGWQASARNVAGRELCGLVQSVSISLRVGGCNAAVYHCDERVRGGKWRCRLCPAEMGELMERVSISALDLWFSRAAPKFRVWPWLGGRRAAAAGED